MVAVVVFEFSGMRCQPLRRALGQEYFRVEYVDRNNQGSGVA
ncbi:TPA: acetyltransferase [Vibrio cholerae]|nr:acetyltransferase [Vibrio cholerae O1 biovar El Tor]MVF82910.1 acetyltransferase [Vibrio cholerae]HAS3213262.1 acetyltransferase [Vibrio cholerae]HAS3352558.1 acetyltransferase [Vibrio cholerae]HAS3356200.1 acetyltransferase [Vibrio cholerae]